MRNRPAPAIVAYAGAADTALTAVGIRQLLSEALVTQH